MTIHAYTPSVYQRRLWTWHRICGVVRTLNRRVELRRLVRWAVAKNLSGPRRLYQRRLAEEEERLVQYTLSSRRLVIWARLLYALSTLISTTPRYPPKGSAAFYRYRT